MDPTELTTTKQTPRGSVVVCGARLLTDEMTTKEAYALSQRINEGIERRNAHDHYVFE